MRATLWLTALLALLLALGIPLPGLAAEAGSDPVPGVPAAAFTPPARPAKLPMSDLARGLRMYRVGRIIAMSGAGSAAGGGLLYAGGRAIFNEGDFGSEILGALAMVVGVPYLVLGVAAISTGATLGRIGLLRAGLDTTQVPLLLSWGAAVLGAALLVLAAAEDSAPLLNTGLGTIGGSGVLSLIQAIQNHAEREGLPPRSEVTLSPAPVSRSPGLALVVRWP